MNPDTCTLMADSIAAQMPVGLEWPPMTVVESIQEKETDGMRGDPFPYLLRSDSLVTCLSFLCLLLFSYAMSNGRKYIVQHLKDLFRQKDRASLFDEKAGSDTRHIVVLSATTCLLCAIYLYSYFSHTNVLLVQLVPHGLVLGTYVVIIIAYVILKWGAYNFVNWIFFDKERNKTWIQTYFDLLGGMNFLLLPLVLFIIYFNLDFHSGKLLILFPLILAKILLFYKCIRIFFNQIHGFLHFILYFCTLEILPFLLLWKGMIYVNKVLILNF